ncbi:MAG: helix-turn-helix domain-containing protein, partial [Corynebacterium sp.]|nr:helix-turn-helix domain-containing protein [Corynebacterium sp.]
MMLHQRIKECRQRAGLTQSQLAAQMGVSRQAVAKWESGRGAPDIEHIRNLAKFFDVSVDFLIAGGSAPSGIVFAREIDLDALTPHKQPGKPLPSRRNTAILQVFPQATAIYPLSRVKKNTRSQSILVWFNALVFDGPFNLFSTTDALRNRAAYYLVTEPNRSLLARVGSTDVAAHELPEP